MDKKITILGAGIIGLSTALAASYCGWQIDILTNKRLSSAKDEDPENYNFASLYPAASILPHSVAENKKTEAFMEVSDSIFEHLSKNKNTGVRQQSHLEIYEIDSLPLPRPNYLKNLRNVKSVHSSDQNFFLVQRDPSVPVSGYSFDVWFANMPDYGFWLEEKIKAQNIKLIKQNCETSNINELIKDSDLVVNCLGAGAYKVFPNDLQTGFLLEGCLVHFPNPETGPLYDKITGKFLSWNYTPLPDVFSLNGLRSDVYFYPRYNDYVLGGTRKIGRIEKRTGYVRWDDLGSETYEVARRGVFPKAIIDVNKRLVEQTTGYKIIGDPNLKIGRRHLYGSPEHPDICLQAREFSGKKIVDAFGFGGAGLTLSWGVALEVMRLVNVTCGINSELDRNRFGKFLSGE